MIDESDPEPADGGGLGASSLDDAGPLSPFASFLLEEHRQRSAEIMQNKIWRYSVRIFAAVSIYVYHTKVYLNLDYQNSVLAASVICGILVCCALYSKSLRYRTRFNAEYKERIESFFVALPCEMKDKLVDGLRIKAGLVGWESYISKKRKAGEFDKPQLFVEIFIWGVVIFGAFYLYLLPTLNNS